MNDQVRILLLDDSPDDLALVELELRRAGPFAIRRADSREPFLEALKDSAPDVVISDYALPGFDGIEALALARAHFPAIPFILISGYIGEERAIEAFEAGITDLVLKDRLSRLVPSVQRALREVAEREAREQLQDGMRSLQSEFAHLARINDLSEMAAAITHEINQPLTAITNYLHSARELASARAEPEAIEEALAPALEQALRAGHIVRRLRQFVGKGDGNAHAVHAADLVDAAVALALTDAREKGIGVARFSDGENPSVNVDAVQIQQVLVNLLRNATQALDGSPPDADRGIVVEIRTLRSEKQVEFIVTDNGPGISPELRERLFQPFVSSKPAGMGIGLSVCRRIVEAHGGTIDAEGTGSAGAKFRFRLPLFEPAANGSSAGGRTTH